jgi:tRNA G37 N-methylase Trm5
VRAASQAKGVQLLNVVKVIDYAPHKYIYRVDVRLVDSSEGSPPSSFSKDA